MKIFSCDANIIIIVRKMVEIGEDFKGTMWETIFSQEYLSDEYFNKVANATVNDFDVNPIEDYFIVKLFLCDYSAEHIATFLKRSLKCVLLRLRLLLQSDGVTYSRHIANPELKALFIDKFKQKAIMYHSFCVERKWIWDVVEVFDQVFDDVNPAPNTTPNPFLDDFVEESF